MPGWNGCARGSRNAAKLNGVDDVAFIEHLIDDMATTYGIDREKVFVLGYSGGGHLVYRLALERPHLFAGFAAMLMVLPAPESLDCDPSGEPVSIMIMNGTADPAVPFEGGVVPRNSEDVPYDRFLSTPETFEYWAELAGLDGEPTLTKIPDLAPDDGSTVDVQTLASTPFEVALVVVHGGQHRIPGQRQPPGSEMPVNRDADAVEMVWEFFSRRLIR